MTCCGGAAARPARRRHIDWVRLLDQLVSLGRAEQGKGLWSGVRRNSAPVVLLELGSEGLADLKWRIARDGS